MAYTSDQVVFKTKTKILVLTGTRKKVKQKLLVFACKW